MKKLMLIISLIVLTTVLAGCKKENSDNKEAPEVPDKEIKSAQPEEETKEKAEQKEEDVSKAISEALGESEQEVKQKAQETEETAEKIEKAETKAAETEPAFDPNEPVAKIYGETITEGDIMEKIQPQLEKMGGQIPEQYKQSYIKQMKGQVVESIVTEKLLNKQVEEKGLAVTDQEVQENLEKSLSQSGVSMDQYKQMIQQRGMSFDEVKEQVKKGLKYQKLLEQELGSDIEVTVDDANKYYAENPKQFQQAEQVQARHILFKTDPNSDPNEVKAEAQEVLKKIKEGADFAEMAKKYSEGPSGEKGGQLGWFGKGRMVPEFEKAAFAMDVNNVSDEPVKTDFGYHIIKVTGKKDARTIPFVEAKENIIQQLTQQKRQKLAQEYIEKLKEDAEKAGNLEIFMEMDANRPQMGM